MMGEHIVAFDANSFHLPHNATINIHGEIKHVSMNWAPICDEDEIIQRMLVAVEDVTEEEKLKVEKRKQDQIIQVVEKLINIEMETFNGFVASAMDSLNIDLNRLTSKNTFSQKYRSLMHNAHTIKGNARILGFDDISEACHTIETMYTDFLQKGEGKIRRDS